jgi:transcription initiation factor TFIIIB Brf1 subunit/transcription initiation factor TFIIB
MFSNNLIHIYDMGETTQKDIAEVARVTEVTVRNRYKELKRQLNLEIPH